MSILTNIALGAALLLTSVSAGMAADNRVAAKHPHRHVYRVERIEPAASPPALSGGRLVFNPALNIACNNRDRAIRAIPCDHPVWVYGNPCEIDEGEGYFRDCGQPPGVGRYDRWQSGSR